MRLIQGSRRTQAGRNVELHGLAGWLLDAFRRRRTLREEQRKQMRVVETLPLGGKRLLMLVACAGEMFLVGGGMESIETIVPVKAALPATKNEMDETCR